MADRDVHVCQAVVKVKAAVFLDASVPQTPWDASVPQAP